MAPDLKLYDHLLQFPLFQGLSRADLLHMAGNTRFGFQKIHQGQTVVASGTPCQQTFFLIDGTITLTTRSHDGGYAFNEVLTAPWHIQPEALFGPQPRYTATVAARTKCNFIVLSKDEVIRMLDQYLVIRLNLFNMLAATAQRRSHCLWRETPHDLRRRIVQFFLDHCAYPAGPKEVSILMTRLAGEVCDSRLDVSRVLNAMQADGQLTLHRGRIVIPSLERLLM